MFENPRRGRQARNFFIQQMLRIFWISNCLLNRYFPKIDVGRRVPCLVKGVDQNAFEWILWLSPPQRLPLGSPIKIAIIEKNRKRAGHDGKREKTWFARSLFLSRQPPHNTKRPPRRRENLWQVRILFCLRLSTKEKFFMQWNLVVKNSPSE